MRTSAANHDSCRSVACPAIGCAAVVKPDALKCLPHRMRRSAAATRQIAGQATLPQFHPQSPKSSPQSHDPPIAICALRAKPRSAYRRAHIRGHHDQRIAVRTSAANHDSCRSVACPAIGCAAVVKPDALTMPDTLHAPVCCRCAPDRAAATCYRFIGKARRRGARCYLTFLNTNTNPTTISTMPSRLIRARRLPKIR